MAVRLRRQPRRPPTIRRHPTPRRSTRPTCRGPPTSLRNTSSCGKTHRTNLGSRKTPCSLPTWKPDAAARHWAFIAESLLQLRQALAALGRPLVVRVGEITHVLHRLHQRFAIDAVWSHEETGNNWTFRRDERVRSFLHSRNIAWHELPQNGVVRRLASRDGWSRQWEARMAAPQAVVPEQLAPLAGIEAGIIPTAADIGLEPDPCPQRQRGGRDGGLERLKSFLTSRGEAYHAEMSSPVTAYESCSRLSPHLAYGTLSIREVVQANRRRRSEVKAQPAAVRGTWAKALAAFEGRSHWHCHFIQKLDSEPRIEFGGDYPAPLVDHVAAAKAARPRMGALRRGAARAEGQKILQRHGVVKADSACAPERRMDWRT